MQKHHGPWIQNTWEERSPGSDWLWLLGFLNVCCEKGVNRGRWNVRCLASESQSGNNRESFSVFLPFPDWWSENRVCGMLSGCESSLALTGIIQQISDTLQLHCVHARISHTWCYLFVFWWFSLCLLLEHLWLNDCGAHILRETWVHRGPASIHYTSATTVPAVHSPIGDAWLEMRMCTARLFYK